MITRRRRKPMPQRRHDGRTRDTQKEAPQRETDAAMTRREWIQGVAATGAALALSAETGLAETAAMPQLLVGAGMQIITPNPLLPVSGGMGPTHPTHEQRGDLTARAL